MKWNSAVVAEHLASNVFADWGGSVELQEHVGLEQVLCAVDLSLGNHCAQTHPFALDVEQHLFALHWVADVVDTPQSGVLVAGVKRLEAVAKS